MKVKNMISDNGNKVPNQFIINGIHKGQQGNYFQSYNYVCAFIPSSGASVIIDEKWNTGKLNRSKTTGKYRNKFLNETKKETQQKINSGVYILTNLN